MAIQSILPGVSGLPLSERSLLRTRELSQADRVTTELVDRLSFSTRASAAGIKIQLTGIALQRLQVFGVRHTIPVAVHSAPLQSHHVVVPLRGRMRARSGVEAADVAPGTAVIYPAGTRLEARWPSQSVALIVTISRGEFDRVCHSNAHPAFHAMKLPASVALTAGPGRSFANVLACLCIECNATRKQPARHPRARGPGTARDAPTGPAGGCCGRSYTVHRSSPARFAASARISPCASRTTSGHRRIGPGRLSVAPQP